MGDATRQEKVTREFVWRLATPSNWVDISKTLSWISSDLLPNARQYDDIVRVTVGDDEVIFTVDEQWLLPDPKTAPHASSVDEEVDL